MSGEFYEVKPLCNTSQAQYKWRLEWFFVSESICIGRKDHRFEICPRFLVHFYFACFKTMPVEHFKYLDP